LPHLTKAWQGQKPLFMLYLTVEICILPDKFAAQLVLDEDAA